MHNIIKYYIIQLTSETAEFVWNKNTEDSNKRIPRICALLVCYTAH